MASPLRWGAHSSLPLGEARCSRGQAWPSLSYSLPLKSRWRVVYCPPRTTSRLAEVEEMAEGEALGVVLDEGEDEWDLREGCSVQSGA